MGEMLKKIYYHDTDAGGVVYYANYLKYFEEARTELLKSKGVDICKLSQQDTLFVVKRVEIDYKSPGRYADELMISTEIVKMRNVSLQFKQKITIDDRLLVSAITQLVCVDLSFKPKAMPQSVIEALKQ